MRSGAADNAGTQYDLDWPVSGNQSTNGQGVSQAVVSKVRDILASGVVFTDECFSNAVSIMSLKTWRHPALSYNVYAMPLFLAMDVALIQR